MRTNGELQRRRRPRPEIKCCQWPGGGGTSAVPGRAGGERTVVVRSVGRAAAGWPRGCRGTWGSSRAAAGVGRTGRAAGPGNRGFEAGPRAGRPRHPEGAARRRVCSAAERRREPAGSRETVWPPGPGAPGELPLPGTPSRTPPPKGNGTGLPAGGASR